MVQAIHQPASVKTSPVMETVALLPWNWQDVGNEVAKLVARAWMDEDFKAKFMTEPLPFLQEAGVTLPDGVDVAVVEGADVPWKIEASEDAQRATYMINIPPVPTDLKDEDLSAAVRTQTAAFCGSSCYCCA